jgi:putative ABC transport system permease protein
MDSANFSFFFRLLLRHLFKHHLWYTLINISGLAVGFVCMLAAILYSQDEFTYDQFHPKSENVYRLIVDWDGDGVKRNWARSSFQAGRVADEIPDIEQLVRIRMNPGDELIEVNDKPYYESKLLLVEPDFFKLFGFQLQRGTADNVLKDKHSIVLTERTAIKYFGSEDPIGKSIRYDGKYDLIVTGVAENPPSQSHIQFEVLISFLLLEEIFSDTRYHHWGQFDHYTYLRLSDKKIQSEVELKMSQFIESNAPDWVNEKVTLKLQPIEAIHLNSKRESELSQNSDRTYSIVFLTAAGLILIVAFINYINLSAAIYLKRDRQMVMHKILGATKTDLIRNLMIESLFISLISIVIAMFLTSFAVKWAGLDQGKNFQSMASFEMLVQAFLIALVIGLFAGIFPALKVSSISQRALVKPSIVKNGKSNFMILTQLVISTLLIVGMLGVSAQLKFFQNTTLGFEDENVLIIPIKDRSKNVNYQSTINRIKAIKGIEAVSFSSSTPGSQNSLTYTYKISGANKPEAAIGTVLLDEHYFELYNIKLTAGKLPTGMLQDDKVEILINQAAMDFFGLESPIGKTVSGRVSGVIVGVVENFQLNSLHDEIGPIIMYNYLPTLRYVSIKANGQFKAETLNELATFWSSIYENYPLEYSFLEDDNLKLYSFEQGIMSALDILVLISMFLAAFGLVGHATFLRQQKAHEYAIRKVLGGTSTEILFKSFERLLPLIIVGGVVVAGLSYWGLNTWLQNFAFRIDPSLEIIFMPLLFIIAFLMILVGSMLYYQLNRSPIKYLREQ